MPKCQHSQHCQPGCPCPHSQGSHPPCHGSVTHISSQGHRSLPQQQHSPAWAWPWAPLSWTLTTLPAWPPQPCHYSHSTVMRLALSLVTLTGLTPLHVLSWASGQPQQHGHMDRAALSCPSLPFSFSGDDDTSHDWWHRACLTGPNGEITGPSPHHSLARRWVWRRQSQGLFTDQECSIRGGSSKVHSESIQLGLSTTFSSRRVVSSQAGWQERLKSFMPAAFQNLTSLWTIQLWRSVCWQQKVGPDELQTSFQRGLLRDSAGSRLLRVTNSLNMQAFLQEFHYSHNRLFLLMNSPAFFDLTLWFLTLLLLRLL